MPKPKRKPPVRQPTPPIKTHTVQDVADIFDISVDVVRRWIHLGKLDAILTPGGQYRIRDDVVQRFLTTPAPARRVS